MWIAITEDDILTVLSGAELTGYRNAAKAATQVDPVQPTIDLVTSLVRGYVGGNKRNTLGAGNTIPEKLLSTALDIIAVRIPQRVRKDPIPSRREAHDRAIKLLEQVARGEFDIEEPAVATDEKSASSVSPSICAGARKFSHRDQDGI